MDERFQFMGCCGQACRNLFVKTPYFKSKVFEFAADGAEFVKRTGFVLMAEAAVHPKKEPDITFPGPENKKANWLALDALRESNSDPVLAKVNPQVCQTLPALRLTPHA